jgi:uncharacterized lipoprotein YddW (UPF0748 family)
MRLAPALALFVISSLPASAQDSFLLAQKPTQELRGVWIHASDGVFASQAQIAKAMEALADARFNVVFLDVWDGDYTLWHSPTAKGAFGSDCDPAYGERDVFLEILLEAHRVGLEVVPGFEAGFTSKGALLVKHPEWAALGKDGKPLELGASRWIDALNPEAQQFFLGLVLELARNFDIDGIAGSELFPALPREAVARPAQLELYKQATGAAAPSDAKDPKWCAWRTQQLTDFLGRVSGALRPTLAVVLFSPSGADLLQDYAGWSEKKLVHALVVPAEAQEKRFVSLAPSASSPAEVAALRAQKIAGEVFYCAKPLLENDAALAKALADGPYGEPAIPPWRSEEGWRPKPLEARPQAGSGRWVFPSGDGPMVMTLDGGLKGDASWSARARIAGAYDVFAWIPPDQPLGESAKYQLATARGLQTITLRVGPPASRGWRRLGEVQLPEGEEFEVARFEAIEKDGTKASAIGPLLLVYDRSASR